MHKLIGVPRTCGRDCTYSTWNNGTTPRLPLLRAETAKLQGPRCVNELPLEAESLTSAVLFTAKANTFYSQRECMPLFIFVLTFKSLLCTVFHVKFMTFDVNLLA